MQYTVHFITMNTYFQLHCFNCLQETLINKALTACQTRIYECVRDTSEIFPQYKNIPNIAKPLKLYQG